jgi:hypothetical protein
MKKFFIHNEENSVVKCLQGASIGPIVCWSVKWSVQWSAENVCRPQIWLKIAGFIFSGAHCVHVLVFKTT